MGRIGRFLRRSLAVRLFLLVLVFAAVPAALYHRFEAVDAEKQAALFSALRERSALISRALDPLLSAEGALQVERLQGELARYTGPKDSLRLLLRPTESTGGGFIYVAAAPPVSPADLDLERGALATAGVLDRLAETCAGDVPLALRVGEARGRTQLLTSLAPIRGLRGCWVLVTARFLDEDDARLTQPYWQAPEVRLAMIVYGVLALLALATIFAMLRGIGRFSRLAGRIRPGDDRPRFAAQTDIPELRPVADAFDRMVNTLSAGARAVREAAEESAHALKTPIATLRQATESMKSGDETRRTRALAVMEQALDRLEELLAQARQIERNAADLLDPPQETVDLAGLARGLAESYGGMGGPTVMAEAPGPVRALGATHLIEAALENLVDNARDFSPADKPVRVRAWLEGREACVAVIDRGPGIAPEHHGHVFDRGYSSRSGPIADEHQGLGLWIVRRNIAALGGRVQAGETPGGGLTITLFLPRA
ncbi:MAG: HAMP domain-containing histidine kinase [Alphaproteobacteria bacterium]|nr:HAMP domain-containing histidine kinase [Alphaproteobacteria bacterium]